MADVQVREARLLDAQAFAGVQHRSWQEASARLGVPGPPERTVVERAWERAIAVPPSGRHRTWVAIDAASGADEVVGVAAVAPATDPDLRVESTVELVLLAVDPPHRGSGHGSRLLHASLQTAADDGESEAVTWVPSVDDDLRRFLEDSGWAPDGAFRTLAGAPAADADEVELRQVRLATRLLDEPTE